MSPSIKALAFFLIPMIFACNKKMQPQGTPGPVSYNWEQFSMGADLSYVNQLEANGAVYKDSGNIQDPFRIFKNHGCNTIRVRLWHNPSWYAPLTGGPLYSDLEDVAKTIGRAKALGMAVNLDIHYSDTWADPGKQQIPAAWQGLPLETLRDSVYNYTLSVLQYLGERNLTPEMVQIGNETNSGFLHPLGMVSGADFHNFGLLLNAGIKAVRDFSINAETKPQIILHVAQLQNASYWADKLTHSGGVTDFDIIGLSHYCKWSTVSTMLQVQAIINNLHQTYGKKVMIVETGFPWTSTGADAYNNLISDASGATGYSVSPEEQLRYFQDLTQAVIKGGGSGVQVWEPAWISTSMTDLWGQGSSWENMCFFDFSGDALPGLDFMQYPYEF